MQYGRLEKLPGIFFNISILNGWDVYIDTLLKYFFLLDVSVSRSIVWMVMANGMTKALGMSVLIIWRFGHLLIIKGFTCD